jgi:hypothetical protein
LKGGGGGVGPVAVSRPSTRRQTPCPARRPQHPAHTHSSIQIRKTELRSQCGGPQGHASGRVAQVAVNWWPGCPPGPPRAQDAAFTRGGAPAHTRLNHPHPRTKVRMIQCSCGCVATVAPFTLQHSVPRVGFGLPPALHGVGSEGFLRRGARFAEVVLVSPTATKPLTPVRVGFILCMRARDGACLS